MMAFRTLVAGSLLLGNRIAKSFASQERGLFRILLLHDVPTDQYDDLDRLLKLLAGRGRLIDPKAAEAALEGEPLPPGDGTPVLLSFDDGFVSNLRAAETVLARYDVKALFFVCPGLMNFTGSRQRDAIAEHIFDNRRTARDIPPDLRLMTWKELEHLTALGHTVGNHTMNHRRLAGLPAEAVEREIVAGANAIHDRLGSFPEWFAYPFGDIESIDAQALEIGARHHRFCRTGIRGANEHGSPLSALFAEHVDLTASALWQRAAIDGALDVQYRAAREQAIARLKPAGRLCR